MLLLEHCHYQVLAGVQEQRGKTSGIQHSAANEELVSKGKNIITNLETNKQNSSLEYKHQQIRGNSSDRERTFEEDCNKSKGI